MSRRKRFRLSVVQGKGRGRRIGVPTINLEIPEAVPLNPGIYACWGRFLHGETLRPTEAMMGALHYGPVPVFDQDEYSLEVHLIDKTGWFFPDFVELDVVGYIREVKNFSDAGKLVRQIEKDIDQIIQVLSGSDL